MGNLCPTPAEPLPSVKEILFPNKKEHLAQVFGVERNHQFVDGRKIVLWSDHKPLVTRSKKPLATAPKRLQRLILRFQQYDFEIRYKPGPEIYLSDTLSRAYLSTTDRSPAEEEAERIHGSDFLPISEPQLVEVQHETAADPVMQALTQVIGAGQIPKMIFHQNSVPTLMFEMN